MADVFAGPSRVWATTTSEEWGALLAHYDGQHLSAPLRRIFKLAEANGCVSVVDEADYADVDWRSEYSEFWSRRFALTPPLTRRLHFFGTPIAKGELHRIPEGTPYLGYVVLRPVSWGRVGRCVLSVPTEVAAKRELALTTVTDTIHLFGVPFSVTGVPFMQQDAEYLRCAHAAAWVCHYVACRKGLVGRATTAELVGFSPATLSAVRSLPSSGLSLFQLQAVFSNYGQPAQLYPIGNLPNVAGVTIPVAPVPTDGQPPAHPSTWDTRLFSIICRYLNSGFPVLVATTDHAFTLVGWYREDGEIRFVACDDQVGPYEVIASPFTDHRLPWLHIMVPLPPKVLLSAEMAEHHAHKVVQSLSAMPVLAWQALSDQLDSGALSLRTQLKSNAAYKLALETQGRPEESVRLLRLTSMANWVWAVEVQDRTSRDAGEPSVVAEVVYDSTSHDRDPVNSALALPLMTYSTSPRLEQDSVEHGISASWDSQLH